MAFLSQKDRFFGFQISDFFHFSGSLKIIRIIALEIL